MGKAADLQWHEDGLAARLFDPGRHPLRNILLAEAHAPAWLRDRLKSETMELWLRPAGIEGTGALSRSERMQLSFVFNGLFGVIGDSARKTVNI